MRFGTAPPLPAIPEHLHWRPVVSVGTCYAGPIEDGERVLRPLRAFRTPLLDLVGPTPYVGFQSAIDSTVVHGWNYYWKSTYLPELRDDLIDVLAEHAFRGSSPRSYMALFHLKGAVSRVAENATAFGNRQVSHAITLDAVWRPGEAFGDHDTSLPKTMSGASSPPRRHAKPPVSTEQRDAIRANDRDRRARASRDQTPGNCSRLFLLVASEVVCSNPPETTRTYLRRGAACT